MKTRQPKFLTNSVQETFKINMKTRLLKCQVKTTHSLVYTKSPSFKLKRELSNPHNYPNAMQTQSYPYPGDLTNEKEQQAL